MKRNYLLSIVVTGLIVLSLYSTYAMFTETIETDEIINLSAATINLSSEIVEYEQITINGNEAKSIMVNISNSTESNLYYGVWYEMVNPTSINSNIEIAKLTSSTDSTQGQINAGVEKNVKIVIKNTENSSITVNVGVGYSLASSLDLPTNRYVITKEIQGKYVINTSVTNGSITTPTKIVDVGNSTSITVTPSTGYKYKSVSCTNAEASYNTGNNTLTLTNITDDVSCTVTNEIITYTVGITASTGGTVSGSSSKTINYNGSTTFTVTPNTGYQYSSVSCPSGITESYNTSNNTLTVSGVKASGTCTVNFTKKTYTVNVSVTNGTSSPTSRTVSHGSSTTFTVTPNSGYEYESLSCTGGSYNPNTKVLTVSNVTAARTCTIKFKKSGVLLTEHVLDLYNNASKSTFINNNITYTRAASVNLMMDIGENIRYYGVNPNNYVIFNNELWRIIGVFKDIDDGTGMKETKIKLVRRNSIGDYPWDSNGKNEWSTATLNTYLNGTYLSSLTLESQAMISNVKWSLGGWNSSSIYANQFYEYERGTIVYSGRSTEWIGKISLMYPSDYLYSSNLGSCTSNANSWYNSSCADTSWLFDSQYEWFLTPCSSNSNNVFRVSNSGYVNNFNHVGNSSASRPVLFLNSTVKITGGTGTSTDPYTLGI